MAEALDAATREEASALGRLVLRAQRGERAAFDELHVRFAKSVHAVWLARLPRREADDGVQETFLCAWERLAGLREPDRIGPWLHAIARNLATDRARLRPAREEPLSEHVAGAARSDDGRDELRERVMAHLRSLPEAYRETLTMRLVEGMTGPEIAAATGLTAGSVRVNLCRGMEKLRELLAQEGWP